jgi:large subunit ribosomal protein L6
MSRIGKKPVAVPKGVKVAVSGRTVSFEGPKGKLSMELHPAAVVKVDADHVVVTRIGDEKLSRAIHGLTRALIANHILGVLEGYKRDLEVHGVGYKAELAGKKINLSVGFANQIVLDVPDNVAVKIEGAGTRISISGCDKQAVGQLAADIRRQRKPEPYKQKGIRYAGEAVRKKLGKQFAGAGAK